jgi:hypothetical protein
MSDKYVFKAVMIAPNKLAQASVTFKLKLGINFIGQLYDSGTIYDHALDSRW